MAARLASLVTLLLVTVTPTGAQDAPYSLDGLVVTASPNLLSADAVAAHVTVLDGDRLRSVGVRPLAEALRDVSGVDVVRNGSFGAVTSIFLRGAESDHTLVLVDGVQVNQAGGGFDFAGLTTDNVERVEIYRGPASALYGSDAMAGVIHVITRTGRGSPRGSLAVEAGSFGRRDWTAGFEAGSATLAASASLSRRTTDGILAFNNRHERTTLTGRVRLRPDTRTDFDLSLRADDREYQVPTDGTGAVVDRNAFGFHDAVTARLSVTRELSHALSLEALLGVNETDGGQEDGPDGPADTLGFYGFTSLDDFRRESAEVRLHATVEDVLLTAGFEAEQERQRSFTESLSQWGPSRGRSDDVRDNRAWFLHAVADRGGVSANGGARLEDNQRFGTALSWQAGASWAPRRDTRLRAAVGTAIKEPTFFESFATGFVVGNPDLRPERAESWEVGAEQAVFEGRLGVSATYFDQAIRDLIQYTAAPERPGAPNYHNVAAAGARGVELEATLRLGRSTLAGGWTWLDTEVVDAGFDSGAGASFVEGEALLRRPRHAWTLNAGVTRRRYDATVGLSFLGKRSDRDFSAFPAAPVVMPARMLLGAGGEWRLSEPAVGRPGVALTVRGENLLGERYEEVYGFAAPGRALTFGGRVTFGGDG